MMDSIAELLGTRLTEQQISDLRNSVTKVGQVPVEIKVQRWRRQLKQLSTVLDIPGGNIVRFVLTPKELNTDVTITAPEGAVSINDAVSALQPPTPLPTPVPSPATPTPSPTPTP